MEGGRGVREGECGKGEGRCILKEEEGKGGSDREK